MPPLRPLLRVAPTRAFSSSTVRPALSLPRILQRSTWFPTTRTPPSASTPAKPAKPWNPATFFIVAFLLIGSNAIQIIAIKHEAEEHRLKTEAKLEVLREVVERIQKGEDVDVEKMLGTGDEKTEKSWEELLKEIEEADLNWEQKKKEGKGRKKGGDGEERAAKMMASMASEERPLPERRKPTEKDFVV